MIFSVGELLAPSWLLNPAVLTEDLAKRRIVPADTVGLNLEACQPPAWLENDPIGKFSLGAHGLVETMLFMWLNCRVMGNDSETQVYCCYLSLLGIRCEVLACRPGCNDTTKSVCSHCTYPWYFPYDSSDVIRYFKEDWGVQCRSQKCEAIISSGRVVCVFQHVCLFLKHPVEILWSTSTSPAMSLFGYNVFILLLFFLCCDVVHCIL